MESDSGQIYTLIKQGDRVVMESDSGQIYTYKQGDRVVMESDSGQIYTLTNKVIGWLWNQTLVRYIRLQTR